MIGLSLLLALWQTVPPQTLMGGLVLLWISSVPILLYAQGITRDPLPFAQYIGAYYFVFFALPVFAAPLAFQSDGKVVLYHRIALQPLGLDVLGLATAGILSMFAAFYAVRGLFAPITFRLRTPDLTPDALNFLYATLAIAGLAYRYVPMLQSIPSIGQFLDPAEYLAFGGFFLQWRKGYLSRGLLVTLLLIAVPLELYWRLRYLLLTDILLLGVFLAFVLWRARNFKTLAIIVTVGFVIASSYTATGAVRAWPKTLPDKLAAVGGYVATMASIERLSEPMADGSGRNLTQDPRISRLVNRIGQIWIFQHVYESSPGRVPYLAGATYIPLFTSLVPRFIYPEKPKEQAGILFGYRYGFTSKPDDTTSFNIPWMVELLANFGVSGVLIGMALFGALLSLLNRYFNAEDMTDLEFLIGLTIIFRLGYQESNFSVMAGSLPLLFVSLYFYFRLGATLYRRVLSLLIRRMPEG